MSHRLSWCRPCGGITTYCFVAAARRPGPLRLAPSAAPPPSACRAAASAWPTAAVAPGPAPAAVAAAAGAGRPGTGAGALCSPCPAVASSSTAVTSRRAKSCWAAAANGTRHGSPRPRTPATSSATRQDTSCAQASQTMQTMTSSTNSTGTWLPKASRGISGIGLPTSSTSAAGTPATMPSTSTADASPRRVSPRRLTRRAPSSGAVDIVLLTSGHPSYNPVTATASPVCVMVIVWYAGTMPSSVVRNSMVTVTRTP